MLVNRLTNKYENGVEEFIMFVVEYADNPNHIKCQCVRCGCLYKVTVRVLRDYLIFNGID